jgi:predicted Rossmann fold flavoprotein
VLDARVRTVDGGADGFRLETSKGDYACGALVVATGGLSIPKMGATGFGYELARQFGLQIVDPRPGLVPMVLGGAEAGWTSLAGVATAVVVEAGTKARGRGKFREGMLVTHRGLSGPAVLQASSYWRAGEELLVDLAPDGATLLGGLLGPKARRDDAALKQALRMAFPQRLANHLAETAGPKGWSNAALEDCERRLHRFVFHPVGTEGFEKAEVTAGGVDTDCLQARTMEARAVPGLFFIGEVVDVTGHLGGFNFQWAWASAVAAGRAL